MPTITPADAIIKAADKLVDAIAGVIPKNSITKDAVLQLMSIYRKQALEASDAASAQRVLRRLAESQQAQTEADASEEQRVETPQATTQPDLGIFEVKYPINTTPIETHDSARSPNPITQDDDDSPPSANTRQRRQRLLTQDYMLHMMEQPGYKAPFTPCQTSGRRFPLQFLCDMAYAILNNKTGDLLEYRHLVKHPKYKDIWSKSFSTKICCLVTTTETIFFKRKDEIPQDRHKDDLRAHCMHLQSREEISLSHENYNGRQLNQLPRRLWNSYSRPSHHQAPRPQQRHIHGQCKVYDHRHQRLLPDDADEAL
jgi:hypothetical protein